MKKSAVSDFWVKYIRQRFSPISHGVVAAGIATSGVYLGEGNNIPTAFFGVLLIFLILRMDNDLKDVRKDRIVYPNRILPQGVIKLKRFSEGIKYIWIVQVAYLAIVLLLTPFRVSFPYALSVLGLWVITDRYQMVRDPLVRNLGRQLILIPLALFACGWGVAGFAYGLVLYGAFTLYDITRKLDPFLHPAVLALQHYYGFKQTFLTSMGIAAVSAVGSYWLGLYLWLWPCEIGVLYTMSLLLKSPRKFHIPALAGALSLLIHVWIGIAV